MSATTRRFCMVVQQLLPMMLLLLVSPVPERSFANAFVVVTSPTSATRRTAAIRPAGTVVGISASQKVRLCSSRDEDDEDDGWGTTSPSAASGADTDRKLSELRSLQQQASNKSSNFVDSRGASQDPPERDMFIPIMAVVSLAGLFGAYGYETLRLASRGELYLPF
mmetsp:Transcript_18909/g.42940  ORF Transcript_18909/g.42940 Transcript_18909/m.42940 type:complete len:166 (+) Transcript_18909:34-531(+)